MALPLLRARAPKPAVAARALAEAKFDATRGKFRFNKNHFPIQDYYLREVYRDAGGRITNKTVGKVFSDFQDVHAAKCKMK